MSSSVFLSRTAPIKSKEQRYVSTAAKRINSRIRDLRKPSECVVIFKKD